VAGQYVITQALHRFDALGGYTTEFSTAPPQRPPRNRNTSYSIGEVSDTNDPEGFGRCRVKLPAFSGIESGWMPVLVAGAGRGKGLIALPETGDDVLVAFPSGDAAHGIILGGLFGRKRMPRGAARKKGRPFVLRTGGGQCLELSATGGLARLSTSIGSLLELTHATTRLASATDLVIEAPGRKITIRAAAVNFEQG
jgi:phage baseplate assembly protein gpV